MTITEEPVQTVNAYVIRVYASYYIITNEYTREDHGERDNRNAFEWAQDAYADLTNPESFMPEPSTNSDFEACWTIAAYEAQEDAEEALNNVNDWLNQDVPAHIRAYHAVIEQHDVEVEEPIIQEQNQELQEQDQQDQQIQGNAVFDPREESFFEPTDDDNALQVQLPYEPHYDVNAYEPYDLDQPTQPAHQPNFHRSISLPLPIVV